MAAQARRISEKWSLSVRLTAMRVTVNVDSSHFCKILTLIYSQNLAKTYLQGGWGDVTESLDAQL